MEGEPRRKPLSASHQLSAPPIEGSWPYGYANAGPMLESGSKEGLTR